MTDTGDGRRGAMQCYIGTAGWTVPAQHSALFAAKAETDGQLAQYSKTLSCVEINSTFKKVHWRAAFERWAATTPDDFRFSVKLPETVTHKSKLIDTGEALSEFFKNVLGLQEKLSCILVQLPPSLAFNETVASDFFRTMRDLHEQSIVVEPRHSSWFNAVAEQLLLGFSIVRVAADPPKGAQSAAAPGGWPSLKYWRLHGTPRTYYSQYSDIWLDGLAQNLRSVAKAGTTQEAWVIFDNTAAGYAAADAVHLQEAIDRKGAGL